MGVCIHFVVGFGGWGAGLCFMGNTNVQGQEQPLQGECHGLENSLIRKPSLLFHLATLMGLNGSNCNDSIPHKLFFFIFFSFFFIDLCKRHEKNGGVAWYIIMINPSQMKPIPCMLSKSLRVHLSSWAWF